MWFVILPVVMSIGTIATIIANYTPVFEIIGKPFIPILQLLQILKPQKHPKLYLLVLQICFYLLS